MLSLLATLLLSQTASNVVVVDPTFQSNKVTTTAAGAKRGLDVNITGGVINISGDGGSSNVNVASWGNTATTLGQKVMASSVPVTFASDQSALTCNQGSPPWSVVGTKTNNAAAPGATNVGALGALANASAPTWTEGNEVLMSVDLSGRQRTDTSSIAGTATSTGNGVSGAGVQRVVIASDQTAYSVNNTQVGTASQNVAQFGGSAVVTGTGASGAGIPRVTLSNDSSLAANQSVNVNQWGGSATTLGQKVMASSVPVAIASDQSAVTVAQATAANLNAAVVGTKTNNAAAPGATNVGALMCLANAAAPTYTEGNLVLASVDLSGRIRTDTSSVAGTVTSTGNGTSGAGVQRVVIASDQTAYSVNAIQSGAWSVSNTQVGTASQNVAQFGGSAVVTGTGASGAGIPRMTISNDSSLAANQSVNVAQVAGTATTVNNGTASAGTQRVVIASDQTAFNVNARVNDSSGNGVESAITEVVGTNRGLLIRPVDKTLTAPVITAVSCLTTSTALPTTAGRKSICIENEGAGDIYIGPTGVTTATGLPIATGATWCDDVGSQAYFCINAVGTNDVRVLEN